MTSQTSRFHRFNFRFSCSYIHTCLLGVLVVSWNSALAQVPPSAELVFADDLLESDGSTVMMRGPLHEAYAEQFSENPTPGDVVGKEPPESINEQPPAFQPEGERIQWITGYWGWDVELQDYIWVTGIWRNVPPGQQWIPGYWTSVGDGWQWISGFWMAVETEELLYLPMPPKSIDQGPSSPAPGDDFFWLSGSWQYNQGQYLWQAGHWAQGFDEWIWVPSRYVWTPSGCIYRTGYWDYGIVQRGTVFCPVVFANGYTQQPFTPNYTVEVGPLLLANLFVAPGFHHYYYGNYQAYQGKQNLYPWVNYYQRARGFDPLYSYYAYQQRNSNWIRQISRIEHQIVTDSTFQSQPTVAGQLRAMRNLQGQQASLALRAAPLSALASHSDKNFDTPFNFKSVGDKLTQQVKAAIQPVREISQERSKLERVQPGENAARSRAGTDLQIQSNQPIKQLTLRAQANDQLHVATPAKIEKALIGERAGRVSEERRSDLKNPLPTNSNKNNNSPGNSLDNIPGTNRAKDFNDAFRPNDSSRLDNSKLGNPHLDRLDNRMDQNPIGPDEINALRRMQRSNGGESTSKNGQSNPTPALGSRVLPPRPLPQQTINAAPNPENVQPIGPSLQQPLGPRNQIPQPAGGNLGLGGQPPAGNGARLQPDRGGKSDKDEKPEKSEKAEKPRRGNK